ncbi:MAG: citrate synthase/methylcitrate synthase [Actinomycetia bacterium]|nr:citrate synthase/methylcitrate synthase [Actinomycetes bacterium]
MPTQTWTAPPGLEGVVVTETALSDVDGATGRLTYRGRPIEEVVQTFRFETLVPWLVTGTMRDLGGPAWRELPDRPWPARPMAALAAVLLHLDDAWPDDVESACRLVLGLPVMFGRAVSGGRRCDDPDAPVAARYLALVTGRTPTPTHVRALDAYWVMAAEHSLNASTFAVRVAASTGARLPLALAAGVGVLSGPRHGGAPEGVLTLLEEIGRQPDDPEAVLRAKLDAGERLMGFGHRVYRAVDPRARALRAVFEQLAGEDPWARLAARTEEAALRLLAERHPERPLATNVEFYAAAVLKALGIPRALCPPTFALGRMAGWTAHWWEERRRGRLIRPLARYRPV